MPSDRSRVGLFAGIRRDARTGLSNRALQRKYRVGYRTVVAAMESAWPKAPKPPPKRGSRLDPYRGVIDGWLREDLDAPRKQRHTAKRIFDRLLDEHDVPEVSYWMVRAYVATRRQEIRIEAGREPAATFIPQEHLPGREAEVDFGEVVIRLRGEPVTCAVLSSAVVFGQGDPPVLCLSWPVPRPMKARWTSPLVAARMFSCSGMLKCQAASLTLWTRSSRGSVEPLACRRSHAISTRVRERGRVNRPRPMPPRPEAACSACAVQLL